MCSEMIPELGGNVVSEDFREHRCDVDRSVILGVRSVTFAFVDRYNFDLFKSTSRHC